MGKLLLAAVWEVVVARVALSCVPFHQIRQRARRTRGAGTHSPVRIARAVTVASRFVPKATCLTQALAAKRLLERHGYECALRFGVAKSDDGLQAHAWIEHAGEVVIGRFPQERFTALT